MKIKKVKNIFEKAPKNKFSNEWKTSHYMFRQVALHLISGTRGSGKSYLASKILRAGIQENLYDRILFISPSFLSNKKQFEDLGVAEEDVFKPEKTAIQDCINVVEQERDEFEEYLDQMELYNKMVNSKDDTEFSDQELINMESLFIGEEFVKPTWKRDIIRPPQIILVMDDILSTPAVTGSSGINRVFMTNRHIGELKRGGALGLSVLILTQTYSTTAGHGIGRGLRENLTELTIFETKQEKQLDKMMEEMGGAIDPVKFKLAYDYAMKERHDNLTISFSPKCPTLTFRRNLNEIIIFDDDKAECKCKNGKEGTRTTINSRKN